MELTAADRKNQIAVAAKFLEDPLLEKISRKDKVTFLADKGIKQEDIKEALQQYEKRHKFLVMHQKQQEELKQIQEGYQKQMKQKYEAARMRRETSPAKK